MRHILFRPALVAGLLLGLAAAAAAVAGQIDHETVRPLLRQPIPDLPGKSFASVIVDFPPGARALAHRHGTAFVYAYVLAGAVVSQLEGSPARTYRAGDGWVEPPGAHHLLTENASASEPARLLVVFIADQGAALKTDDPTP